MSSAPQTLPYFQRAWHISVNTLAGEHLVLSSSDMENPLRATFHITRLVGVSTWIGEVVLYNVNSQTLQTLSVNAWDFNKVLQLGDSVFVSAGYKYSQAGAFDPNTNEVYSGTIFQPIWTRENVVDTRLTLRCVTGFLQNFTNWVNRTYGPSDSYQLVQQVAKDAGIPFASASSVDQATLANQTFSRGQTVFGRPFEIFVRVAKDNGLETWMSTVKNSDGTSLQGLNLRSLKPDPNATPAYTYAPVGLQGPVAPQGTQQGVVKRTLIGTPEQTQYGVMFKVLLDSQPQLGDLVQIAPGTAINRLAISPGQYPGILDQKGLYVVAQVEHSGDTRGGDTSWYTQITGLTYDFFPPSGAQLYSGIRMGG